MMVDGDFDSLDGAMQTALSVLLDAGKVITGDALLGDAAPVERLASLVGLSLDSFHKGDA